MMTKPVSSDLIEDSRVLKVCRKAIGSNPIFAACFYGPKIYGYAEEKADLNVLLIVPNYSRNISSFTKRTDDICLSILVIDKKVFENDVKCGQFGEFVADIIVLPYQPWINPGYLERIEVEMKKRFVSELLKNVIMQYPELSTELLIKPEFFMYEVIRRRAKLFPPLMYSFLNIFNVKTRKRNTSFMMNGYLKALKELEKENYVVLSNGYIKIDKDFIEATKLQRNKFSNILMSIRKALFPYIRGISSRITTAFLQDRKIFANTPQRNAEIKLFNHLEETEKYLLMPTPLGPVPLSDKTDIQDFVRKTVPGGEKLKITIEEMGGVLNSVFLLSLQKNHETQKIVVKKFEDWLGFKWFPLALWTLGTHSFAVLGKTRLEREYSINQFLKKHGFAVPRILYVSLRKRLIFEEFVDGEKISEIVKQIITSPPKKGDARNIEIICAVGREIAKAHSVNVSIGDCKPENLLISKDKKVYFLDLEQATRNGNQPWDIAEFLYYSGHYILPTHSDEAARMVAFSFIEGYLAAGGKREIVKKAASAKYTKVFSVFTLPHIILIMANICKKMGEKGDE
jgi:tRNA A-37 threonylcarbamoyl transferase component Bud32